MRALRKTDRVIYLDERNMARMVRLDEREPLAILAPRDRAPSVVAAQIAVLVPAALASGIAWGVPGATIVLAVGGAVAAICAAIRGLR